MLARLSQVSEVAYAVMSSCSGRVGLKAYNESQVQIRSSGPYAELVYLIPDP